MLKYFNVLVCTLLFTETFESLQNSLDSSSLNRACLIGVMASCQRTLGDRVGDMRVKIESDSFDQIVSLSFSTGWNGLSRIPSDIRGVSVAIFTLKFADSHFESIAWSEAGALSSYGYNGVLSVSRSSSFADKFPQFFIHPFGDKFAIMLKHETSVVESNNASMFVEQREDEFCDDAQLFGETVCQDELIVVRTVSKSLWQINGAIQIGTQQIYGPIEFGTFGNIRLNPVLWDEFWKTVDYPFTGMDVQNRPYSTFNCQTFSFVFLLVIAEKTFLIEPRDYLFIGTPRSKTSGCTFRIQRTTNNGIGIPFFRSHTIMFDAENHAMGFCVSPSDIQIPIEQPSSMSDVSDISDEHSDETAEFV